MHGMTFKPFRALCLEGASCCCFDLYAPLTSKKLFENENGWNKDHNIAELHAAEVKSQCCDSL